MDTPDSSAITNDKVTDANRPSHGDLLLTSLRDLRDQDIVQDFTIHVGEVSFRAHRAVLAGCSDYFRAMFSHNTKENGEGSVEMKEVDAFAVGKCIEYMYTGKSDVTVETAAEILNVARVMQIDELTKICFGRIEENLCPDTCLAAAELLKLFQCNDLEAKVENYIKQNFDDVILTEKFCIFSAKETLDVIFKYAKNDDMTWKYIAKEASDFVNQFLVDHFEQIVSREEFVDLSEKDALMIFLAEDTEYLAPEKLRWNAVLKWIKFDETRTSNFPTLLRTINFSELSHEFIENTIRKEVLMENNLECISILMDGVFDSKSKDRKLDNAIAVMLRDGTINGYRYAERKFFSIPTLPNSIVWKIFSINNKLCLLANKSMYYLNKSNNWVKKTDLKMFDPKAQVTVLGDKVFFVGQSRMQFYDIVENAWKIDLPECRITDKFFVTGLNGRIYAFGEGILRFYDLGDNQWQRLEAEQIEHGSSATSYRQKIYILCPQLQQLVVFIPENIEAQWETLACSLHYMPVDATISVGDNKLIVSYEMSNKQIALFGYDFTFNQWITITGSNESIQPALSFGSRRNNTKGFFGSILSPQGLIPAEVNPEASNSNKKTEVFRPFSSCSFRMAQ
uniref:kelch-like protein 2 n=1 Tax=Styela clava TaxID=7725 RepID=UPI001939EB08|nr:kelch-like protein 2 [Styela clava]